MIAKKCCHGLIWIVHGKVRQILREGLSAYWRNEIKVSPVVFEEYQSDSGEVAQWGSAFAVQTLGP